MLMGELRDMVADLADALVSEVLVIAIEYLNDNVAELDNSTEVSSELREDIKKAIIIQQNQPRSAMLDFTTLNPLGGRMNRFEKAIQFMNDLKLGKK